MVGASVVGFDQDDDGVTVHLADGREKRVAILVGADGLNSAVRAHVVPEARPRYLGYQSLWAIVPAPPSIPPGELVMTYGHVDRFGFARVGRGRVWWFGVILAPEGTGDSGAGATAELLERFDDFAGPAPELIMSTPPGAILRHDVYDLHPLARWSEGRVALLGDAAHACSVAGARGASEALADAVALAESLSGTGGRHNHRAVVGALLAYEERRWSKAAAVQARSRRIGEVISWRQPLACAYRSLSMRTWGARRSQRAVEAELAALGRSGHSSPGGASE